MFIFIFLIVWKLIMKPNCDDNQCIRNVLVSICILIFECYGNYSIEYILFISLVGLQYFINIRLTVEIIQKDQNRICVELFHANNNINKTKYFQKKLN